MLLPAEIWRDRRSHVDVRAPIRRPCLLCVCNLAMLHPHIVAPTAFHTMIWNTAKAFQSFVFFPPVQRLSATQCPCCLCTIFSLPSSSRSTLRRGRLRPVPTTEWMLIFKMLLVTTFRRCRIRNIKPQPAFFPDETYFTSPLNFQDCFPTWRTAFLSASTGR